MIPDEYITSLANFPRMLQVRGELKLMTAIDHPATV